MTGNGDVFEFEGFRLDPARMGVWKHDERVLLEPKALDVLIYLVANRDRLVLKDELLDSVWKDTFVTPNVLTRAIAQLRKGLGDEAGRPRVIETVARRGYRFIAPVTIVGNGHARAAVVAPAPAIVPAAPRRYPRLLALAAVLVLIAAVVAGWRGWASRAGSTGSALNIEPLTSFGDVIDAIVSPDGKYLAFIRSAQGKQSMWIRQLRGTNAIQLARPEPVNYYGMSFAPDSGSIYYVLRGPEPLASPTGMLFQIPALGGPPRRLGVPFDHYPVMSPDGTRLASFRADYPDPGNSALVTINADGSGLRALMTVREPDILAPGFFVAPSWSPSGLQIAGAIRNGDARAAHLFTLDVATGAARHFGTTFGSASFTAWLPDNSGILFTATRGKPSSEFGSDLWFQPLPDGPPRPITTGVVEYRSVSLPADGSLAVSVGNMQNAGLWRVPLGGGRLERIPSQKEDGLGGLAWLDAATIVFTSFNRGTSQIWTMDVNGDGRHQITAEGSNSSPVPTGDGRTIFFVADRQGRTGIWRMDRSGAAAQLVAPTPELWDLALSPDERSVLFTAPADDRVDSTWVVPASGGTPALLIKGLTHAAVAPGGEAVAGFWQKGPRAEPVLAIFSIAGGAPRSVFEGSVPPFSGGVWWSPDGRAIYYTNRDRLNVWRQPVGGGAAAPVTDLPDGMIGRGDLSPDGRSLLAVRANPLRDAFLISGFR